MELTIHNVKAVAKPIVFYWMTKTSQLPCSIDFLILNAYRFGTFILLIRLHPVSRCHHSSDLERRVTSVGFTTWIFHDFSEGLSPINSSSIRAPGESGGGLGAGTLGLWD